MSYVYPNTNLKLIRSCPLDPSYEHTIYFSSASDQNDYFSGLGGITLSDYSYQRVERGYIKVNGNAENAYTCNYLMFQNTSFGSKWFYGFITGVEYVSNVCYYVYFEIDVMQTYMFNHTVGTQYVLREHASEDVLFSNLEPENVDVGEYVANNQAKFFSDYTGDKMNAIIQVINVDGSTTGTYYDGMYSGCKMYCYPADDTASIDALLSQYTANPENVVAMYCVPQKIANYNGSIPEGAVSPVSLDSVSLPGDSTTLDGYKPKNRKMYSYPYNFYAMTNPTGDTMAMRYEYANNDTLQFRLITSFGQPVTATVFPYDYNGVTGDNTRQSISISNYPQLSWASDSYNQWVAQNGLVTGVKAITSGFAAGAGLSVGGGAASAALGVSAAPVAAAVAIPAIVAAGVGLSKAYTASKQADVCHGSPSSGSALIAGNDNYFLGSRMSCEYHRARVIDEYFSRFGYATNRLKTPNTHTRPHWNFVQTSGFTLKGSCPAEAARKICQIYDTGITFWMDGSEVGNYSLDNSPA